MSDLKMKPQLHCKNGVQINIFPSLSSLKQAEWSICFKPHSFGRWQRWQRSETGFCATWLSKVSERNSVEDLINPTPGEQPKTKVKHFPQSLQSEFHPDQSFRNWESLKDSSIYHSLNYRSIILGVMLTNNEVPIILFTLQIPSIIKDEEEERGKPPDTKGL